jgi:hypothetical protein
MDGVWLPADGDPPVARGLPGSRYKPRPGGQIGVWTGLIIPAPIWREGRDSPSGCEIMDDVTKGAGPYAPLPPPPTAGGQNASVYQAEPDQGVNHDTSGAGVNIQTY